jgi:hypothetical protein
MSERVATHGETTMNTSLNHGSAKIYQFPAGGRSALGGRDTKSVTEAGASGISEACAGSWYHEAAIQESKPARDR